MYYMNGEYPMWQHTKKLINSNQHIPYDLIIIGDSRAKAGFIPSQNKKIHSLNLSIGGSTPIEGYYTLKKYLENNTKPDKILLSYSPIYLSSQDTYWQRTVKFNYLSFMDYVEVEFRSHYLENFASLSDSNNVSTFLSFYNLEKYIPEIKMGFSINRYNLNKRISKYLEQSGGHIYFGNSSHSSGLNREAKRKKFKVSILTDYYLKRLLELAKKNNINIYYYTMPFNKSSYMKTIDEYKNDYNKYVDSIAREYNMQVCNQLFYLTDDNFGDPSHLYKGAKDNTLKIYKCILE